MEFKYELMLIYVYPVHSLLSTKIPIIGQKVIEIKSDKKYYEEFCYKM